MTTDGLDRLTAPPPESRFRRWVLPAAPCVALWIALAPVQAVAADSVLGAGLSQVRATYLRPQQLVPALLLEPALQGLEQLSESVVVTPAGEGRPIMVEVGGEIRRVEPVGDADWSVLEARLSEIGDWVSAALAESGAQAPISAGAALLDGIVSDLDRHSKVLSADRMVDFRMRYGGTLAGAGARIGVRAGEIRVLRVYPDTPAQRAGLLEGDLVYRVDGLPVTGFEIREVVDLIRGKPGSVVRMEVMRGAEQQPVTVRIQRDRFVVPSVHARRVGQDVALVAVDRVSAKTPEEFGAALQQILDGGEVRGLVVDLRRNQGGSMKNAGRLANYFVPSGTIFRTEGWNGERVPNLLEGVEASPRYYGGGRSVVFLVSGRTASAAELIAGAAVNAGSGIVVGQRTYGKATVQRTYPLTDGGSLKLTVGRYLLKNDLWLHGRGLTPDVRLLRIDPDTENASLPDGFAPEAPAAVPPVVPVPGLVDRVPSDARPSGPEPLLLPLVSRAASGQSGGEVAPEGDEGEAEEGPAEVEPVDPLIELAADILRRSGSSSRTALLTAAAEVVPEWRAREERTLRSRLAEHGIAWGDVPTRWYPEARVAPGPLPQGLSVALRFPAGGLNHAGPNRVSLDCRQLGPGSRRHLRAVLRSPHPDLDGLTWVIGDLRPGEARTSSRQVTLGRWESPRRDPWELVLLGDEIGALSAARGEVVTQVPPPPEFRIRVEFGALPAPQDGRVARVQVGNAGEGPSGPLALRFLPSPVGAYGLREREVRVPAIAAGGQALAELGLTAGKPGIPSADGLRLEVRDLERGVRLQVPVGLPHGADAAAGGGRAPWFGGPVLRVAAKEGRLTGEIQDADGVETFLISAGKDRIAHVAGDGRGQLRFDVPMPALEVPGQALELTARDVTGAQVSRWVHAGGFAP